MAEAGQESDWNAYRRLVLDALLRVEDQYKTLTTKIENTNEARNREIADIRVAIGMLKVQATMWASLASVIVSAVASLVIGFMLKH